MADGEGQYDVEKLERLYGELQAEWTSLEKEFVQTQRDIQELLDKVKIKHTLEHIMKQDV